MQSHALAGKPHCHSLKAEACSFFTAPLNPSYLFSLLLCPLYFSFPFPQFMLFPSTSSFILVKQISLRLLLHCFLYDTVALVFKSQLIPISLESEPTRLGVVLSVDHWKWSTQNQEGWVCRSSKGHVCSGFGTVSWAWTECHAPEFCLMNLSNFPFQLLWMFREKLELGAVTFRVFPGVIISNLRLQKESRGKQLWTLAKQQEMNTQNKSQSTLQISKAQRTLSLSECQAEAVLSGVRPALFSQVCTLGWCQV